MKIILPDGSVEEAKDELRAIRHTASHVLAQAVKRLYPETKLAIGPAIDDGFYYDFDREGGFTPDDLEKLEAEMKKIVKENLALKRIPDQGRRFRRAPDQGLLHRAQCVRSGGQERKAARCHPGIPGHQLRVRHRACDRERRRRG